LGEEVEVIAENATQIDKAPKASQVIRIQTPNPLVGIVELFDFHRGYGFAKGTDGQNYHLHKSEFLENKIPRIGQELVFFGGLRMGKPRACHVKICPVE
jgi:cold shock CspA family protein